MAEGGFYMEPSATRMVLSLGGYWLQDKASAGISVPMERGIRVDQLGARRTLRRRFILPAAFLQQRCVFYSESLSVPARVYINNILAHVHYTRHTAFSVACNDLLQVGDNEIRIEFEQVPEGGSCPLLPPMNLSEEIWCQLAEPLGWPRMGIFGDLGICTTPWAYIVGCRATYAEEQLIFNIKTLGDLGSLHLFIVDEEGNELAYSPGDRIAVPCKVLETWRKSQPTLYRLEVQAIQNDTLMDHWMISFGIPSLADFQSDQGRILNKITSHLVKNGDAYRASDKYLWIANLHRLEERLSLCDALGQKVVISLPPLTKYAEKTGDALQRNRLLEALIEHYWPHPSVHAWALGAAAECFSADALEALRLTAGNKDPFQRPLLSMGDPLQR